MPSESGTKAIKLRLKLVGYADDIKAAKKQLSRLDQDYKKISTQLDNAFDLVEQGVYTLDMFQTRRMKLTTQLDELDA